MELRKEIRPPARYEDEDETPARRQRGGRRPYPNAPYDPTLPLAAFPTLNMSDPPRTLDAEEARSREAAGGEESSSPSLVGSPPLEWADEPDPDFEGFFSAAMAEAGYTGEGYGTDPELPPSPSPVHAPAVPAGASVQQRMDAFRIIDPLPGLQQREQYVVPPAPKMVLPAYPAQDPVPVRPCAPGPARSPPSCLARPGLAMQAPPAWYAPHPPFGSRVVPVTYGAPILTAQSPPPPPPVQPRNYMSPYPPPPAAAPLGPTPAQRVWNVPYVNTEPTGRPGGRARRQEPVHLVVPMADVDRELLHLPLPMAQQPEDESLVAIRRLPGSQGQFLTLPLDLPVIPVDRNPADAGTAPMAYVGQALPSLLPVLPGVSPYEGLVGKNARQQVTYRAWTDWEFVSPPPSPERKTKRGKPPPKPKHKRNRAFPSRDRRAAATAASDVRAEGTESASVAGGAETRRASQASDAGAEGTESAVGEGEAPGRVSQAPDVGAGGTETVHEVVETLLAEETETAEEVGGTGMAQASDVRAGGTETVSVAVETETAESGGLSQASDVRAEGTETALKRRRTAERVEWEIETRAAKRERLMGLRSGRRLTYDE
ncbi:hypothetical protein M501DRAFT_1018103 [Patellaria atrata CBS 101060]|uniref:Uncharacterized protein n=1 Tax=Patellaria atrata CBS 101060 TaxID=1346257 RepID=A0A9P4VPX3_9PEZI|nr:hypothetical protein M501DRAFT_1018103 [Patellaria atrata CBS 101060]